MGLDQDIYVISYSIRWEAVDQRNIFLIRYEWNRDHPQREDHPMGHLHIDRYNDLRLPTGKIEFRNVFKVIENWIEKRREIDEKSSKQRN